MAPPQTCAPELTIRFAGLAASDAESNTLGASRTGVASLAGLRLTHAAGIGLVHLSVAVIVLVAGTVFVAWQNLIFA
jgi:hypothetical protein